MAFRKTPIIADEIAEAEQQVGDLTARIEDARQVRPGWSELRPAPKRA